MQSFTTTDNVVIKYLDTGLQPGAGEEDLKKPWLILIHGFTGSHLAYSRNIPSLSKVYRVVAPDLRGHGESGTPDLKVLKSATVVRLAVDLGELIVRLAKGEGKTVGAWRGRVMGGSLGCAVIWTYAHLYTTTSFTHTLFIDQSPLQNRIPGSWDPPYCHKGLQTSSDLAAFRSLILSNPKEAHLGTIHSCLGYLSHPDNRTISQKENYEAQYQIDEPFFLGEALKGDPEFYVELMTDHTALDHRENIREAFGPRSGRETKVLVVASAKSGCFEPEGVLSIVGSVNDGAEQGKGLARGETVEWGGHWCYWEDHEKFDELALEFFAE